MYKAQIDDLKFMLENVTGFTGLVEEGRFGDLSGDLVGAILEEAGRFAEEVIAPLNRAGDIHGCTLDPQSHAVTTAPGWREAYRQWCEAGWAALPCDAAHGGQGLPISLGLAVQELWNTAASAYGIGTLLTQGAVEAISAHGSDDLKARWLAKMVSGAWTGTMNLTESQAGSDLAALNTRARPVGDGTYRITGTKIFITYGEHDLTDNIVHLVLARLEGAPEGTHGLSLFLVPKYLVGQDGGIGARNEVRCIGLEHKLGIHGSPTCTLRFGDDEGALGYLVGEENRGLACMFTMMNNARLHVGMQGVAVAERACQQALAYARERRQGRRKGTEGMVAINEHPDVRRMLLDMTSRTAAARAICYETALALDLARHGADQAERAANEDRAALLTPLAKAFGTDTGCAVASLGIQVHGGMGYIEETGAAQHWRDARITQIYEGTNGIQALDLVTRKVPLDGGGALKAWIGDARALCSDLARLNAPRAGDLADRLGAALGDLETASDWIGDQLASAPDRAMASAAPYLDLFARVAGQAGLARGTLSVLKSTAPGADDRLQLAHYFAVSHLALTPALCTRVTTGADAVLTCNLNDGA